AAFRPIAAANIEHDRADAAPDRNLRAHSVSPEAVDLALLQRSGGGDAEIDAGRHHARHRRDLDAVADEIDPGADEEAAQSHFDPRGGADAAAFDARDIAAFDADILVHDQEPVHALGLRADELHAVPFRKCRQRRVGRSADEIDRAVA